MTKGLGGRPFERETQLVKVLGERGGSLFPGFSLLLDEVSSGYGVADLVFVRPSPAALARRLAADVEPLLSAKAIQLFLTLATGLIADEDAFRNAAVVPAYGRRLLCRLHDGGYLGHTSTHAAVGPTFDYLVAVEAKLTDWRRAIQQAVRYRTFADEVYVALPMALAQAVASRHLLPSGVGLIGVDPSRLSIIARPARSDEIENWRRLLVSEELVRRLRRERLPSTDSSRATGYPFEERSLPGPVLLAQ